MNIASVVREISHNEMTISTLVTYLGSSSTSVWFRRSFNRSTSASRLDFASCSKTTCLHSNTHTSTTQQQTYITHNISRDQPTAREKTLHLMGTF